jgi:hypothetical protein
LVEHQLPKLRVAGSNPVSRSRFRRIQRPLLAGVFLSKVAEQGAPATRAAGSLDLRFKDGTAYQQPFDLAICPVTVDLCGLVGSLECVPGFPPWVCIP